MGVLDWKAPNNQLHQVTQAIHHGTAMALRFLPQILDLESKVKETDVRPFVALLMLLSHRWHWGQEHIYPVGTW